MNNTQYGSWTSAREHEVTVVENFWNLELHQLDLKIAAEVSQKYGIDLSRRASALIRYPSAAVRVLMRTAAQFRNQFRRNLAEGDLGVLQQRIMPVADLSLETFSGQTLPGDELVSIIIPTRGSYAVVAGRRRNLVVEAVRDIIERTTWSAVEIVIVADDDTPQETVNELEQLAGDRLILVRWRTDFNFSAKMNLGAAVARGQILLLLNDDIEVVTSDWIEQMLTLVRHPEIGMVGAMLFFGDGSIQHLGHLYSRGSAGHIGVGVRPGPSASSDLFTEVFEVSGVTAACALIRADVFRAVGGFASALPGNYNDVDLALKVREAGYRILCTGRARLYHFESLSRNPSILRGETIELNRRWGTRIQRDEFIA